MEIAAGVRVRIKPHFWWPEGAVGTVQPFPGILANIPHSKTCGIVINPDGCTRPYQDMDGPSTMVWVVFDEPTYDFEGAGPYQQGENLSQYLEHAGSSRPDNNSQYYPGSSVVASDGTLLIVGSSWSIKFGEMIKPDDPDYKLWQWLIENSQLFPQISSENITIVRNAFSNRGRWTV